MVRNIYIYIYLLDMPEKILDTLLRGYKMGTLAKNGLKCHETILNQILFCYLGFDPKDSDYRKTIPN